jgi:2-oxoglutarate dehydrogenase complex dehydrogenase (E1) component-like enzyme
VQVYCGSVGVEFSHVGDPQQAEWLNRAVEKTAAERVFLSHERLNILSLLQQSEVRLRSSDAWPAKGRI